MRPREPLRRRLHPPEQFSRTIPMETAAVGQRAAANHDAGLAGERATAPGENPSERSRSAAARRRLLGSSCTTRGLETTVPLAAELEARADLCARRCFHARAEARSSMGRAWGDPGRRKPPKAAVPIAPGTGSSLRHENDRQNYPGYGECESQDLPSPRLQSRPSRTLPRLQQLERWERPALQASSRDPPDPSQEQQGERRPPRGQEARREQEVADAEPNRETKCRHKFHI